MAKKNTTSVRVAKPPTNGNGNGKGVTSKILLSLPATELEHLLSKLEFVRLALHQLLYDAGDKIKSGYFVNSGLMSVLAVQPQGKSVEVGLIGNEGFIGLPLLVGYHTSPTRIVVQGDATAYRCDADAFRQVLQQSPELEKLLHRFAQRLAMQTAQIAACNQLHDVEERLARWILMTQDRTDSNHLPLTQELLSQILGTRRASVTVAAGILQKAGLISYTRGNVTILDRLNLEAAACDCYGIVQHQLREWDEQTN